MTRGWVNNENITILGWTVSLKGTKTAQITFVSVHCHIEAQGLNLALCKGSCGISVFTVFIPCPVSVSVVSFIDSSLFLLALYNVLYIQKWI